MKNPHEVTSQLPPPLAVTPLLPKACTVAFKQEKERQASFWLLVVGSGVATSHQPRPGVPLVAPQFSRTLGRTNTYDELKKKR